MRQHEFPCSILLEKKGNINNADLKIIPPMAKLKLQLRQKAFLFSNHRRVLCLVTLRSATSWKLTCSRILWT